jgi:hypothetical protein
LGYEPENFWRSTLRTYATVMEAAEQRLVNEHNGRAWQAWHVVALQGRKRLPPLSSLFAQVRRKKPQTVDEMKAAMRMIASYQKGIANGQ